MTEPADNPFDRLGLPRRFALPAADLERAYLAASRAAHPDHHAGGGTAQLAASEAAASAINVAYATLKDPFRRADALLTLLGGPTAAEEKSQDPLFLMEMMDFRERLEAGDPHVAGEVEARRAELLVQIGEILDAGTPDLARSRKLLNAARTMRSLLRERED